MYRLCIVIAKCNKYIYVNGRNKQKEFNETRKLDKQKREDCAKLLNSQFLFFLFYKKTLRETRIFISFDLPSLGNEQRKQKKKRNVHFKLDDMG